MSFQGHMENGLVVLDEPVSLPNGTVVRIEPVELSRDKAETFGPVVADADQPCTMQQMARAWNAVAKPNPEESISPSLDPVSEIE